MAVTFRRWADRCEPPRPRLSTTCSTAPTRRRQSLTMRMNRRGRRDIHLRRATASSLARSLPAGCPILALGWPATDDIHKYSSGFKAAGDCPDFSESARENGTVPLSAAVLRLLLVTRSRWEFEPSTTRRRRLAATAGARAAQGGRRRNLGQLPLGHEWASFGTFREIAKSSRFGAAPAESRLVFQGCQPPGCDKRSDFWSSQSCFSKVLQKSKTRTCPAGKTRCHAIIRPAAASAATDDGSVGRSGGPHPAHIAATAVNRSGGSVAAALRGPARKAAPPAWRLK